jgi:hypothetical protein
VLESKEASALFRVLVTFLTVLVMHVAFSKEKNGRPTWRAHICKIVAAQAASALAVYTFFVELGDQATAIEANDCRSASDR